MYRFFYFIILLFCISSYAPSCWATNTFQVEQLSTGDGLGESSVNGLIQDATGQIWIATGGGLNVYDGYNVSDFVKLHYELTNESVNYIFEDSFGVIWIGTLFDGIYRFDRKSDLLEKIILPVTIREEGIVYPLNSIVENGAAGLWLSTGSEIFYFNRSRKTIEQVASTLQFNNNAIRSLLRTSDNLLVGTTNGLFILDPSEKKPKEISYTSEESENQLRHNIKALVLNRANQILIGTGNGVYQLESSALDTDSPPLIASELAKGQNISAIIEKEYFYWIATEAGIFRLSYDGSFEIAIKLSDFNFNVSSDSVISMIEDREENLWLGTNNDGLFKTRLNKAIKGLVWNEGRENLRINSNNVTATHRDSEDVIWIGTDDSLERFEPSLYRITSEINFERPHYISHITDNNNQLWINTAYGIKVYDRTTMKEKIIEFPEGYSRLFSENLRDLYFFEKNVLTLLAEDGIYNYDVNENTIELIIPAPKGEQNFFYFLLNDKDTNQFLLGTADGLAKYSPDEKKYTIFHRLQPYEKKKTFPFHAQKVDNTIWVVYPFYGIAIVDAHSGVELRFISEQELGAKSIMDLFTDSEGNLWLSAINGLFLVNKTTYNTTFFDTRDGFLTNQFSPSTNEVVNKDITLLGSVKGALLVDLNKLRGHANLNALPNITSVSLVSGRAVSLKRLESDQTHLELKHSDIGLKLEFSSFLYFKTDQVKYRYSLRGEESFDSAYQSENTAFFSRLYPGDYTFTVWATDPLTGVESQPTSLDISVQYAPFSSPLAYTIYLLIFSIFTLYFILMKRKHKEELTTLLAQKEELLEKKNELFSNVSHEFRTPLTLILGPIKKLLKTKHYTSMHSELKPILSNANRLLRMVDQLLDLSRFDIVIDEVGQLINASELVEKTLVSMDSLFEEHQLQLIRELEDACWISITHDALEKIMVNLFSNAVKYTPRGGSVIVRVFKINEEVKVIVKDNGVGISPSEKHKIFERFVRLDNSSKEFVPGAGVGLALVKELAERFEGSVGVESEEGAGSCFTLVFPSKYPALDFDTSSHHMTESNITELEIDGLQVPANEPMESHTKPLSDNSTILIVEDNSHMRQFIAGCLESHYVCISVEDGREGIRTALEEIPDLIITDLMMPNKTGFELARIIRADQRTSHIPIIMLTAKGDISSRQQAWKMDIDDYFEKPFDQDELLLRCESLLSIRQLICQRVKKELENGDISTPREKKQSLISKNDRDFIEQLNIYLESNYSQGSINAERLSDALDMNKKQLQRKVRALLEQSIPEYVSNFRLKKGSELLLQGLSVTEVAMSIGFSSPSYFTKTFTIRYGMSPSEYIGVNSPKI